MQVYIVSVEDIVHPYYYLIMLTYHIIALTKATFFFFLMFDFAGFFSCSGGNGLL